MYAMAEHLSHVTTAMQHTMNDDGSWVCPVCHPKQHRCPLCDPALDEMREHLQPDNPCVWMVDRAQPAANSGESVEPKHTHQWTYGYMVRTCWCGDMERATQV